MQPVAKSQTEAQEGQHHDYSYSTCERARFHCADGAGGDVQDGRHHGHRRPSNTPAHAIQEPRGRHLGVRARRTIPEPDSLWAVNPASFLWGWVCWGDGNKILGEKLVSIGEPLPDVTELPDKGFPWQQEMAVDLKCVSGTDAGTEVVFKTNTEGGKGEVIRLIEAVRDRLGGQHEGKVSPIVRLENSSYPHPQYGKTWVPVLTVADWMSLDGPAARAGRRRRRRRPPSSRVAGASPDADAHLKGEADCSGLA